MKICEIKITNNTMIVMLIYFSNGKAFQTKIVGGQDADPKDFPWLVLFGAFDDDGNINEEDFTCGGSIISSYWVLTASHCICKPESSELVER